MAGRRVRTLVGLLVAVTVIAFVLALAVISGTLARPFSDAWALRTTTVDRGASLPDQLDQLLTGTEVSNSTTSAKVIDTLSGEVLFSRQSDRRLVPASTAKLLTSAAALSYLGPDYRFHTTVLVGGRRSGRTVHGNLYVRGTGDPTLTQEHIDTLAAAVEKAGITTVTGHLVADDTAFDRTSTAPGWPTDPDSTIDTAPISALTTATDGTFDTASVAVSVKPSSSGEPAVVQQHPDNTYLSIENKAVTGDSGSPDTVTVQRPQGSRRIIVTGSFPESAEAETHLVSVDDPTALAASVFRESFRRHNVTIRGTTVQAATPSTATTIRDQSSIPLRELLVPWMKLSNNAHAELVTKAIGRKAGHGRGTWDNGLDQIDSSLTDLGVDTDDLHLVDGSGLSLDDRVTTSLVTALLQKASQQPGSPTGTTPCRSRAPPVTSSVER